MGSRLRQKLAGLTTEIDWYAWQAIGASNMQELVRLRDVERGLGRSVNPRLEIWVDDDLHAWSMPMDEHLSVMLHGGMVTVIEHLPEYAQQVWSLNRGTRPRAELVRNFASWLDQACARCDKRRIETGIASDERQLAQVRKIGCLAFIIAHEIAHHCKGVTEDVARPVAGLWSPVQAEEIRADAAGLDLLVEWYRDVWDEPAERAARLAVASGWLLLTGLAVAERFEERLRPQRYPTARDRRAALLAYARSAYGGSTGYTEELGPDLDMVAEAGLARCVEGRTIARSSFALLLPALVAGRGTYGSAARRLTRIYLASPSETLTRVEEVFAHPELDPQERARSTIWQFLGSEMPADVWNSFSARLEPMWIEGAEAHTRRVVVLSDGGTVKEVEANG